MTKTHRRKPGDIVYLKSGSIPMVVEAVFSDDSCQVRWMSKKHDRRATFCGTSLSNKSFNWSKKPWPTI